MNPPSPQFHNRALVSMLTAFSFLLLAASGIVLFVAPPGRIANWTNWSILGLRKSDWGAVHIWFAAIFVVGTAFHLLLNLHPLLGYLKNRATRRISLRREWVAAAVLCALVFAGTLMKAPPFEALVAWNEEFKQSWEQPAERAPIPHAELLTFAALAEKGGVDVQTATARLAARGVSGFNADTQVRAIAEQAGLSAREVFALMVKPSAQAGEHVPGVGGGVGWKTLAQFCADERIEMKEALARLSAKGITAHEHLTLREIASRSGERKPYELLEIIRAQ